MNHSIVRAGSLQYPPGKKQRKQYHTKKMATAGAPTTEHQLLARSLP
jgi:hypothetical protein